eukprot:419464_1
MSRRTFCTTLVLILGIRIFAFAMSDKMEMDATDDEIEDLNLLPVDLAIKHFSENDLLQMLDEIDDELDDIGDEVPSYYKLDDFDDELDDIDDELDDIDDTIGDEVDENDEDVCREMFSAGFSEEYVNNLDKKTKNQKTTGYAKQCKMGIWGELGAVAGKALGTTSVDSYKYKRSVQLKEAGKMDKGGRPKNINPNNEKQDKHDKTNNSGKYFAHINFHEQAHYIKVYDELRAQKGNSTGANPLIPAARQIMFDDGKADLWFIEYPKARHKDLRGACNRWLADRMRIMAMIGMGAGNLKNFTAGSTPHNPYEDEILAKIKDVERSGVIACAFVQTKIAVEVSIKNGMRIEWNSEVRGELSNSLFAEQFKDLNEIINVGNNGNKNSTEQVFRPTARWRGKMMDRYNRRYGSSKNRNINLIQLLSNVIPTAVTSMVARKIFNIPINKGRNFNGDQTMFYRFYDPPKSWKDKKPQYRHALDKNKNHKREEKEQDTNVEEEEKAIQLPSVENKNNEKGLDVITETAIKCIEDENLGFINNGRNKRNYARNTFAMFFMSDDAGSVYNQFVWPCGSNLQLTKDEKSKLCVAGYRVGHVKDNSVISPEETAWWTVNSGYNLSKTQILPPIINYNVNTISIDNLEIHTEIELVKSIEDYGYAVIFGVANNTSWTQVNDKTLNGVADQLQKKQQQMNSIGQLPDYVPDIFENFIFSTKTVKALNDSQKMKDVIIRDYAQCGGTIDICSTDRDKEFLAHILNESLNKNSSFIACLLPKTFQQMFGGRHLFELSMSEISTFNKKTGRKATLEGKTTNSMTRSECDYLIEDYLYQHQNTCTFDNGERDKLLTLIREYYIDIYLSIEEELKLYDYSKKWKSERVHRIMNVVRKNVKEYCQNKTEERLTYLKNKLIEEQESKNENIEQIGNQDWNILYVNEKMRTEYIMKSMGLCGVYSAKRKTILRKHKKKKKK